jgi:acetyltransferase
MQPSPTVPHLTIITNAGGPALMALDQINRRGGKLAEISDATIQALKSILPYYCSLTNPIDLRNPLKDTKGDTNMHRRQRSNGLLVIYAPTN